MVFVPTNQQDAKEIQWQEKRILVVHLKFIINKIIIKLKKIFVITKVKIMFEIICIGGAIASSYILYYLLEPRNK